MIAGIHDLLAERARMSPGLDALVELSSSRRLDYRTFDGLARRIAAALAPRVAKGDRLGILAGNGVWHAAMLFAAARLGAVLVPLNWRLTAAELAYQLDDCAPSIVVFDAANAHVARNLGEARPDTEWMPLDETSGSGPTLASLANAALPEDAPVRETGPDDGFLILYTSGTTGRPKGALHTHGSSLAWCRSTIASFEGRLGDRQLLVAPQFHIAGICVVLMAAHRGAVVVIAGGFDPGEVWRVIEGERITGMFAVPTMINMMREHPDRDRFRRDTLRWIMCGAAPVPVTLIDAYAAMGIDIHQVYGSTETHGGICILPPEHARSKKGSTGVACFGMEVRVVDAQLGPARPGERGEIVTRGAHVFREYWRNPDATRDAFRNGWFHIGDIGDMDADGFLTIRDRAKDMIISGGENVYPAEVEDALMGHPGVLEVAVIGRADEKWGEVPHAIVVRRAGWQGDDAALFEELAALCVSRLAGYKQPKGFEVIAELPRNASGKVLKHVLRAARPAD
jgi:acyl-CoA synthetase (AMP-forming)/AMP-acid ligase II